MKLKALLSVIGALTLITPCAAQAPSTLNTDPFTYLFPKPTGKNGYEEWTFAGTLPKRSKALEEANQTTPRTLTQMRRTLSDPLIVQAREIWKVGMAKPMSSPRSPDSFDENTLFPELALFRNMGRVLRMEIYVAFAEGRVSDALDTLGATLDFGYRIQTDTLISGLVGIAINSMVLKNVEEFLGQLSVKNCDSLSRLVDAWLQRPSPLVKVMEAERRGTESLLRKKKGKGAKAFEELLGPSDPDNPASRETVMRFFKENPGSQDALIDQTIALANTYYRAVIIELSSPAYLRKPIPEPETDSLAGELFAMLRSSIDTVAKRYDEERARMQRLGIHAAIRKYKWQWNRLPETLDVLKRDDLTLDPLTGDRFRYEREGETYRLGD